MSPQGREEEDTMDRRQCQQMSMEGEAYNIVQKTNRDKKEVVRKDHPKDAGPWHELFQ